MRHIRFFIVFGLSISMQSAFAQSRSHDFYAACLTQANHEYRACRNDTQGSAGCRHEYRDEKDRCWEARSSMSAQDPYYLSTPYGVTPRFEPTPIPQRFPYASPGPR